MFFLILTVFNFVLTIVFIGNLWIVTFLVDISILKTMVPSRKLQHYYLWAASAILHNWHFRLKDIISFATMEELKMIFKVARTNQIGPITSFLHIYDIGEISQLLHTIKCQKYAGKWYKTPDMTSNGYFFEAYGRNRNRSYFND